MVNLATRKKICILVFSDIAHDGRVLRQVEYARKHYDVDVVAHGLWNQLENVTYFQLARSGSTSLTSNILRLFRLAAGQFNSAVFEQIYWQQSEYLQALQILKDGQYDLIHANDWTALPVASRAVQDTNTCLLFDAHEYTPAQFDQYFTGRYLKSRYYEYMLHTYSRNIQGIITVSDGIAKLYKENFGWEAVVVRNAPEYVAVEFHPTVPTSIQLVHHGSAVPGRHLENLIRLTSLLDNRFNLTLILVSTDKSYLAYLKKISSRLAPHRINFLNPVSPNSLVKTLAAYDMGVHLLTAANLNHLYALPNKFFEFIIAGLGIAVFPLPEMSKIIREYQIGVVSTAESIHFMASMLNDLTPGKIDEFKRNSLLLAKTLNGDAEMIKLMNIYSGLLST